MRSLVLDQVGSEGSDACVQDFHPPEISAGMREVLYPGAKRTWQPAEAIYDSSTRARRCAPPWARGVLHRRRFAAASRRSPSAAHHPQGK